MNRIIPTIFAYNKDEFKERFSKLIKLRRDLHIDFMDGKFVKSSGIRINDIPNLKRYKIKFEAHLMTLNPALYISLLKKKGFYKIIFHYEALKNDKDIEKLIRKIKRDKMEAWIALNPDTDVNRVIDFLDKVDGVLFMGVRPGREHQHFISRVYDKIKGLRKIDKKINIQVDGGVNLQIARKLKRIGVNYFNSGSFIANAENPKEILREFEKKFI